jgi:hypothetical protein
MVNSSSSVLSEAPCSNFPQVSARLLVSPPPKQSPASTQVTTSPSAAHSICSQGFRSSGCSRVSFTHFETNSEQGPITMQTRIAVRDTTPHRFQIIPLREAKSRYNLNQITTVQHIPEDLKHQPHTSPHLDLEPSFIPTLSQPPLLRTFVSITPYAYFQKFILSSSSMARAGKRMTNYPSWTQARISFRTRTMFYRHPRAKARRKDAILVHQSSTSPPCNLCAIMSIKNMMNHLGKLNN